MSPKEFKLADMLKKSARKVTASSCRKPKTEYTAARIVSNSAHCNSKALGIIDIHIPLKPQGHSNVEALLAA